jgi:signal transduction histidine kinase/ActR/RegA family two-component response regulator
LKHLKDYPSTALTTAAALAVSVLWIVLRLALFRQTVLPLTFVLPLMLCVWTRRSWQLWGMAALFLVVSTLTFSRLIPVDALDEQQNWTAYAATAFNILAGAFLIQAILKLRDHLEARNESITAQNAELEAQTEELSRQAEELAQQNEEIKGQSEELTHQNEEIESQAEELERQNQELGESNGRLASRESILHSILLGRRRPGNDAGTLESLCRGSMETIGSPCEAFFILENSEAGLQLRGKASAAESLVIPQSWPVDGSIARVVFEQDKTAYIDDLLHRPDLAAPFDGDPPQVRSILATPIHMDGAVNGLVVAASASPAHWTTDQFRLIEWTAAECGLVLEAMRWQRNLRERADAVEAANRAKDQFLAMLSHELRTPLAPVLAAAAALETDARLPDDVRDDLAMMKRNVAMQSRLIDDLLDVTRIGRGKLDLHPQLLAIGALLREAAAIVAADLDAKDLTLSMQLDLPPQCAIVGDGARLQQVFWNLLKNSIKFSHRNGRIHVNACVRSGRNPADGHGGDDWVVVSISDTGAGIPAQDLSRIFRPFEQSLIGRQTGGGLGLGLSIAKAIIDMHDGAISVASDGPGRGATFTVELAMSGQTVPSPQRQPAPRQASAREQIQNAALPAAPSQETASIEQSASTAPDRPRGQKLPRILLVEDHVDTGRLMARLLRLHNYEVAHVETIQAALSSLRDNNFDLIISDLGLPDGSGLDLIRQIKQFRPDITAICLSGYGMSQDINASREAGFVEHLTKPVDMPQMLGAIQRATLSRASASVSG